MRLEDAQKTFHRALEIYEDFKARCRGKFVPGFITLLYPFLLSGNTIESRFV